MEAARCCWAGSRKGASNGVNDEEVGTEKKDFTALRADSRGGIVGGVVGVLGPR